MVTKMMSRKTVLTATLMFMVLLTPILSRTKIKNRHAILISLSIVRKKLRVMQKKSSYTDLNRSFLSFFIGALLKKPLIVILLFIVVTLCFGWRIPNISFRTSILSHFPSTSYSSGRLASVFKRKESDRSEPRAVAPHATDALYPIRRNGLPAQPMPRTLNVFPLT